MASSGNFLWGLVEVDSIWARGSARERSTTAAAKTFSICGDLGESSESTRSATNEAKAGNFLWGLVSKVVYCRTALTVRPAAGSRSRTHDAKDNSELDADIWSQLHEHQQAMIIAKLPLKELFQMISLSNTWRLRFHSDPLFQNDVCRSAASWKPYAPLYVNGKEGRLVGYQRDSQKWHQLEAHTHLKKFPCPWEWSLKAVGGPLFCWVGEYRALENSPRGPWPVPRPIYVANLLTKSWKVLPPHPQPDLTRMLHFVHVLREENQAYKVLLCSMILAYNENLEFTKISIDIKIFDSTNGSWNVESYSTEEEGEVELPDCQDGGSAVIQGAFYILFCNWKDGGCFMLLSLDLKKKLFKETILLRERLGLLHPGLFHVGFSQLLVCGLNLMLVIGEADHMLDHDRHGSRLTIFRFDLERLTIIKVSQAPNSMLACAFGNLLTVAACDGDVIYVGHHRPLRTSERTSFCYNVGTQQWDSFNCAPDILSVGGGKYPTLDWEWKTVTYQPGLDPFLRV